ncbi:hypothetical protein [Nostoc sp.]|uniref:hypothetical protein n=1 Tax=Nostoc sp. TaxID=1180 RepID=UPI002FF544C6
MWAISPTPEPEQTKIVDYDQELAQPQISRFVDEPEQDGLTNRVICAIGRSADGIDNAIISTFYLRKNYNYLSWTLLI